MAPVPDPPNRARRATLVTCLLAVALVLLGSLPSAPVADGVWSPSAESGDAAEELGYAAAPDRPGSVAVGRDAEQEANGAESSAKDAAAVDVEGWVAPGEPAATEGGVGAFFAMGALGAAKVSKKPFDHVFVEGFIPKAQLGAINRDFPPSLKEQKHVEEQVLRDGGEIKGDFAAFLDAVRSVELREALEKKFNVNLKNTGRRISLRGISDKSDGNIHADLETKVVTVLFYLSEEWPNPGPGGHLRLLRTRNIEDYTFQAPSYGGNMLAFLNPSRGKNKGKAGFHGFKRHAGERRAVQLNYQVGFEEPTFTR